MSALTNVLLDYDFSQNLWTYHTLPDVARSFGLYTSSGQELLSFGDANGEVFTWDSGTTDDGMDIDTNIEIQMWPNGPETATTMQFLHVFGDGNLGDVDMQFAVDGGSYSTAVDLSDDYSFLDFGDSSIDAYGRELQLKFSESGGTNQWRLDGFSVENTSESETDFT